MAGRIFLGRYEPLRLLGEGGMGRVYLARQIDLGRQVVVKVMHDHIAADPKFHERFQRETLLMARFQHPYAVTLYDASLNDPHGPCIVMEYIKGITLDELLKKNKRLNPPRIGRLLDQLCEALQAAHDQGIVHRDLKPSNLMVVDPETPYEKIKVMDFGLAKLLDDSTGMAMYHKTTDTGTDFAVGTPGYISPEQIRGEEVNYACDIYSVGVILFELLTGRLPFIRDDAMDVLIAHATEPPPTFEEMGIADSVSPEVEHVVMSCLAKMPNERPGSARDLALMFREAMHATLDTGEHRPLRETVDTPLEQDLPETPADQDPVDPNSVVFRMEAWMPDAIATHKLRYFVQDISGTVLESVPGRIVVRIGPGSEFSWFGLRRKYADIDLELRMERKDPKNSTHLAITAIMTSPDRKALHHAGWRERCSQIFCELRGYLAGASVS
jgi:serine/threonine protein kinase